MNGRARRGSDSGTFVALGGLLLSAFGLLFLAALVMPQAAGLVAVFAGLILFGAFHYAVWGWWLAGRTAEERVEEAAPPPWQPPTE